MGARMRESGWRVRQQVEELMSCLDETRPDDAGA